MVGGERLLIALIAGRLLRFTEKTIRESLYANFLQRVTSGEYKFLCKGFMQFCILLMMPLLCEILYTYSHIVFSVKRDQV